MQDEVRTKLEHIKTLLSEVSEIIDKEASEIASKKITQRKLMREIDLIEWKIWIEKNNSIQMTPQEEVTINEIEKMYDIGFKEIVSGKRDKKNMTIKKQLVKQLRDNNWLTFERISELLWARHHTSIIYLYWTVKNL